MGTHVPELAWIARMQGLLVAEVRTVDNTTVEIRLYDDEDPNGVSFHYSREEAGQMAHKIIECLKDTSAEGKYGRKNKHAEFNLARDIAAFERARSRREGS